MKSLLVASAAVLPLVAAGCGATSEAPEEAVAAPGAALPTTPALPAEVALEVAEEGLLERARVSDGEARTLALVGVWKGRMGTASLREEGGRPVYAYEVVVDGRADTTRVWVDAITGRVLPHEA